MLMPLKKIIVERLYFDGFGSQYLTAMASIAYCDHMRYRYFHNPFTKIHHAHSGKWTNALARAEELNRFIGIPPGLLFSTFNSNICLEIVIIEPCPGFGALPPPQKRAIVKQFQQTGGALRLQNTSSDKSASWFWQSIYGISNVNKFSPHVLSILRQYYYSTPKPNTKTSIALHIRRGDVDKKTHSNRYIDNNKYKKIIRFLLKTYPDDIITIFSEGSIHDFHDLQQDRVVFQLNGTIEETFHSFVRAKVLVTAKSTFSYSAALLNENEVYYIPWWHKPLKHWKTIVVKKGRENVTILNSTKK
jgi:hypothetical protein